VLFGVGGKKLLVGGWRGVVISMFCSNGCAEREMYKVSPPPPPPAKGKNIGAETLVPCSLGVRIRKHRPGNNVFENKFRSINGFSEAIFASATMFTQECFSTPRLRGFILNYQPLLGRKSSLRGPRTTNQSLRGRIRPLTGLPRRGSKGSCGRSARRALYKSVCVGG